MTSSDRLPAELAELLPAFDARQRLLSTALPAGRTVRGNEGNGDRPVLWLSDQPPPSGLWARLSAEHQRSGLWPLLLDALHLDAERPWQAGELWPEDMSSPDQHDAGQLLAAWWSSHTEHDDPDDELSPRERLEVTAPYGDRWPGLAAPGAPHHDPDQHADDCAEDLLRAKPAMRLGLVAADRGADALTLCGWQGAANYTNDTAELSAVLRSWEDRFGACVIAAGFSELYLSIAAPPTTTSHAQAVAAEHFAFCPDNIWQGTRPFTLAGYAESLLNAPTWSFWWD